MAKENFTSQTVILTSEQYAKVLYCSHFISNLIDLVDNSGLDLPCISITPLLAHVALDLQDVFQKCDKLS